MKNKDTSQAEVVEIKRSELQALQDKIYELELKISTWLKLQADVNIATANFTQETQKALGRFDETIQNVLQTIEVHQYILSGEDNVNAVAESAGLDLSLPDMVDDKKLMN